MLTTIMSKAFQVGMANIPKPNPTRSDLTLMGRTHFDWVSGRVRVKHDYYKAGAGRVRGP